MPIITCSFPVSQSLRYIKNTCYSSASQHSLSHLPMQVQSSPALSSFPSFLASDLSTRTPDALQKSVSLGQSVQCIVALAHATHKSTKRKRVVLAGVPAILIDLCNGDLHRGVVLGFDDAVGCRALAGN